VGAHPGVPAEVPEGFFLSEGLEVLLVGGDGFLGSHVAAALSAAGHRVTVLSRGRHATPSGAVALKADRRDAAALAAVLAGRRFDFTADLAAYDAAGVEALWSVRGLQLGRYVMISSGQVYMVTDRPRPPFREPASRRPLIAEPAGDSTDHPQWSYGVGKRGAEAIVLGMRRRHGARAIILRLPVVQGEGDPSLRLWAWLERMLDGGPILLPDGGRRATRFLDARDAGAVVARLASGPWPAREVYNLAAPRITPLRRFLTLTARAAGLTPRFVGLTSERTVERGLDPLAWPFSGYWSSVLDPSRARRELGFTGTSPEEYLPRVVRWHLEHRPSESYPGYEQRPLEREVGEAVQARAAKAVKRRAAATDDGGAAAPRRSRLEATDPPRGG
jgi:nucleoside-diphosphate-sugar epimerase